MKTLFTTEASNTGGRDGKVTTADGKLNIEVATPSEMGGAGGKTSPEQLFAAGYSSCFNGALNLALKKARAEHGETKVTSVIDLLEDPADKGFMLSVKMKVYVPGMSPADAHKYAEMAHKICPYSKAVAGNIDVTIEVETDQ